MSGRVSMPERDLVTYSIGDTKLRLVRRACDLYDVYLVAEDVETGEEARSRFESYTDGRIAFRMALHGCTGIADNIQALVGKHRRSPSVV